MEDYKKKYEDMFVRLNNLIDTAKGEGFPAIVKEIEAVFPELQEIKFNKIKKVLQKLVDGATDAFLFLDHDIHKQDVLDWLSELKTPQEQQEEIERAYKNSDEVQYKQGYVKALKDCAKEFGDKYNDAFEANHKNHIYKPTISYNDTLSILEKLEDEINEK